MVFFPAFFPRLELQHLFPSTGISPTLFFAESPGPTCRQAVTQSDVVQLESATAPGLTLCYRLYSGMKVRGFIPVSSGKQNYLDLDVPVAGSDRINGDRINGLFHLLIVNGVYWV